MLMRVSSLGGTMTATTAVKLGDIPKIKWLKPQPGWFSLGMYYAETLKRADGLPTADKHDEVSVNACAKQVHFGNNDYLVVVSDCDGNATAIYQEGEKLA